MGRWVGWPLCPHQAAGKAVKPWFLDSPSVINSINKFKNINIIINECESSNYTVSCTLTKFLLDCPQSKFYQTYQIPIPAGQNSCGPFFFFKHMANYESERIKNRNLVSWLERGWGHVEGFNVKTCKPPTKTGPFNSVNGLPSAQSTCWNA